MAEIRVGAQRLACRRDMSLRPVGASGATVLASATSCASPAEASMRAGRRMLRGAVAAAGLLLLGAGFAPGAQARTSCAYAGAPRNVLIVTVSGSDVDATAVITRNGLEITVRSVLEAPKPCVGGTPTVLNTDTVYVQGSKDASADLRLDGGPFAPGATPEAEGASEIEIQFSAIATVVGAPLSDEFHWGPGGAEPGLNLNPRSAGDQDVDVTTVGNGARVGLSPEGAGGNDTIIGEPGAVVPGRMRAEGGRGDDVLRAPPASEGTFLDGGSGNDLIVGTVGDDALYGESGNDLILGAGSGDALYGGSGNDLIVGAGGNDFLEGEAGDDRIAGGGGRDRIMGGRGKDRLSGGAGRDTIDSRDSARDTVNCGPGRDRVKADRRDRLRGCERVSRR